MTRPRLRDVNDIASSDVSTCAGRPAGVNVSQVAITGAWAEAIDAFLNRERAGGAPNTTLTTRRQHLQHMGRRIDAGPFDVSADILVQWFGRQDWKRETRRGRRTTLRAFYGWAHGTGRMATNPALELPRVKAGEAVARPAPDGIYTRALIAAGERETLMLRLAAEYGLRRAEVAGAHADDLFDDLGGVSLRVHGKGERARNVPLAPGMAAQLRALGWGFFFPGDDNGHLSPRWVGKLITNLLPDGWTMHTLRHRFATRAYAVDRDVFTVQELLGHASPATTRRYVQIPNDALRATVIAAAS